MKSTLESLSPTRVRLVVEMTPEDLRPALDNAFRKIASQVNIPGFRRGKVPAAIIEQRFGRSVVLQEALEEAVPAAYERAIIENEVAGLGQPNIVIDQDLATLGAEDVLEFTAEVDVRPEITLPDYAGLAIEVADNEVTEEDVTEQLDELRARFATVTPVEREVGTGDLVVVDVVGESDGEELDEFTSAGMTFEVGTGKMIAGFDEAVTGASEGDVVEFVHTPTEGDLAGKDIALKVTVKGVRQRELPAADDDFAQLASEFDTLEELTADLRLRLARVKLVEQGIEARDKINEFLLANTEVPIPDGLLAQLIEQHFTDGHGDEAHREEFAEQTRESLRSQFLLDALAEQVGAEVAQDDVTQWIIQQAPRYDMTPDQFVQTLVQADQLNNAIADVRRAKALSVVLEQAVITDASGQRVDLSLLDDEDDDDDANEVDDDNDFDDDAVDDLELDDIEAADEEKYDEYSRDQALQVDDAEKADDN